MKLVIAIVGNDDAPIVLNALTKEGFHVTKLSTTGGFLRAGNTTFLIGVEKEKVDKVIEVLREYSSKRTQVVPSTSAIDVGMYTSFPVEITVGGATVFVIDVEKHEKL